MILLKYFYLLIYLFIYLSITVVLKVEYFLVRVFICRDLTGLNFYLFISLMIRYFHVSIHV